MPPIRLSRFRFISSVLFGCFCSVAPANLFADEIPLSELDLSKASQEWEKPGKNVSVDGHTMSIAGQSFNSGVGGHAAFELSIATHGTAKRFTSEVGIDDEVKGSPYVERYSVIFTVFGDGKVLFRSKPLACGLASQKVDVDLTGVKQMVLEASTAQDDNKFCHADFADATISYTGERPETIDRPVEQAEILTPAAGPQPRINSALAFGVRPTHPVLYTIAATGDRPMKFSAQGLPDGVKCDPETGQLSGTVAQPGTYTVQLQAENDKGVDKKTLSFVVGDKIALTPPMGWNSWNCFATDVSDKKVRAAADAMVSSHLIDHGWTYINIDDCWEVPYAEPENHRRAEDGHILTNRKFPDMKALAGYIHSKGLRAGLYSSPGPFTCGEFTASYQHEEDDARQYAAWGFDYLKYDWCSFRLIDEENGRKPGAASQLERFKAPYRQMHDALLKQDRDVLFSFCQYGWGDVWEWGEETGGNCWRTTGDIVDNWQSLSSIVFSQNGHEAYAGPGHWNDPDMLVVGMVGWGPQLHPTHLTPNEQYLHISMWSMLSAPLLIGCDMTQMDKFTFSLLSNDEVIAVNQDPLGVPAARVWKSPNLTEAWTRPLSDGTYAVAIINRGPAAAPVHVRWSDLRLAGTYTARDLWRQKGVDVDADGITQTIGRHGCVLLKLSPVK